MRIGKKYFYFYSEYLEIFNKLSIFQQRKLLKALCNYVESGEIPYKLSKKGFEVFNKLKIIIDFDKMDDELRIKRMESGKTGAEKRWNNSKVMAKNSKVMAKNSKKSTSEAK